MFQFFLYSAAETPYFQTIPLGVGVENLEIPRGAYGCWIQAVGANARWRADGTAPAAGVGMILYDGDEPTWFSEGLSALQFIAASGSPVLNVQFKGVDLASRVA